MIFHFSYQHLLLHLLPAPSVPGSFYSTWWRLMPLCSPLVQHLATYSTLWGVSCPVCFYTCARRPADAFGDDWCDGWSLNLRNENWKSKQKRRLFTLPNERVCPGGDFCFIALSLFISAFFFFLNSKPEKKSCSTITDRENHWAKLHKEVWKTTTEFTLAKLASSFLPSPSVMAEMNLLMTSCSPNFI